jgi:hypothetical protein
MTETAAEAPIKPVPPVALEIAPTPEAASPTPEAAASAATASCRSARGCLQGDKRSAIQLFAAREAGYGPPLPTCAAHQSRQHFEVLRTCRSNGRRGRF